MSIRVHCSILYITVTQYVGGGQTNEWIILWIIIYNEHKKDGKGRTLPVVTC